MLHHTGKALFFWSLSVPNLAVRNGCQSESGEGQSPGSKSRVVEKPSPLLHPPGSKAGAESGYLKWSLKVCLVWFRVFETGTLKGHEDDLACLVFLLLSPKLCASRLPQALWPWARHLPCRSNTTHNTEMCEKWRILQKLSSRTQFFIGQAWRAKSRVSLIIYYRDLPLW